MYGRGGRVGFTGVGRLAWYMHVHTWFGFGRGYQGWTDRMAFLALGYEGKIRLQNAGIIRTDAGMTRSLDGRAPNIQGLVAETYIASLKQDQYLHQTLATVPVTPRHIPGQHHANVKY